MQTAESVGAAQTVFDFTLEWTFNRYSFGRPLASYQELKHRFADMKMWLEASHALADAAAAREVQADRPARRDVSAAKAYTGDYLAELVAGLRADARRDRRHLRPRHPPLSCAASPSTGSRTAHPPTTASGSPRSAADAA